MEFTKREFENFRADLKQAVAAVEAKYKVNIHPGSLSYSDAEFEIKVKVTKTDVDADKVNFEEYCELYGFKKSDYQLKFKQGGKEYILIAFDTRKRKNPCKIKEIGTGNVFLTSPEVIFSSLNRKPQYSSNARVVDVTEVKVGLQGKHKCKYCGAITDGTDDDVLCPKCREKFGHSLFSEL